MPHEAALRVWLLRKVASPADAQDVIQECYCRLSDLENFAAVESPRAYLFTMARNVVLQEARRARIVRIEAAADLEGFDPASSEPLPDRIVAGRQELALVRKLIAQLPERTRRIVEMRKIHGFSQKEIARRLGVSVNVVENEASRGLKLVLAQLSGDTQGEGAPGQALAGQEGGHDDPAARIRR